METIKNINKALQSVAPSFSGAAVPLWQPEHQCSHPVQAWLSIPIPVGC